MVQDQSIEQYFLEHLVGRVRTSAAELCQHLASIGRTWPNWPNWGQVGQMLVEVEGRRANITQRTLRHVLFRSFFEYVRPGRMSRDPRGVV